MNQKEYPVIYRKRYIPDECICLKDDLILSYSESLLVTSWQTLKPRKDISRGISAYFIDQGIKVSKVYDRNDKPVYWYCDIIHTNKKPEDNTIIFEDLLIDVLVFEDGSMRILDLDEACDAYEQGIITDYQLIMALRNLNHLTTLISNHEFSKLQNVINEAEQLID